MAKSPDDSPRPPSPESPPRKHESSPPRPESRPLAIETKGLSKRFGHQLAVDGVDLAVPAGSVFGFLGPNGSGKTSTIRMLLGLTQASAGEIRLLDGEMPRSLASVLPRVGALVEGPAFAPYLTGRANLHRLDTADRHADPGTRKARVAKALDRVGLTQAADKKAHAYSLGMKQRLGIANALLMPRDLLILDEPSNGLDPQGTREVRSLISSLADEGTTVFVSSHLLSEIEQMCTHVAVMSSGRLLTQGTLAALRAEGRQRVRVLTPDPARAVSVLQGLGLDPEPISALDDAAPDDVTVIADLPADGPASDRVTAALVEGGVRVRGLQVAGASLEDRFVDLTGEGFDVAQ